MKRFLHLARNPLCYVSVLALLSGCTTVYEGKYRRADGWRRGTVLQVVSGEQLERPQYFTCTRHLSPEQRASNRYVMVRYVEYHQNNYYAAEAPADQLLQVGGRVYVNVYQCRDALIARLEQ